MIKLRYVFIGIIFIIQLSLSATLPNIILMGPPGCGKGTFAEILKQNYGYYQISIGDILRWHVRKNTKIGKLKEEAKKAGKYLEDAIVFNIIEEQVLGCLKINVPFILDNFPRNVKALNFIVSLFKRLYLENNVKFIRFQTSDKTSFARLLGRFVCPKIGCACSFNLISKPPVTDGICDLCKTQLIRRPSDTEENTKRRLGLYRQNVEPLADTAKLFGYPVIEVNADGTVSECEQRYISLIRTEILLGPKL